MSADESADYDALRSVCQEVCRQLRPIVVGQDETVEQILIAILAGGHCLLEGGPGSARSLIAASMAQALGLDFRRVRCTADLTAEEVTGESFGGRAATNNQLPGPLMAHMVLVDDISRLSPGTLSVVQHAMQDREVLIQGHAHPLPSPFVVLATKYRHDDEPADVESEPRDDRFLLKIAIRYPDYHDEYHLARVAGSPAAAEIAPVLSAARLLSFQQQVLTLDVPPPVIHYAVRLVRATRVHEGENPDFVYEWVRAGAGPRAVHHLTLAAKIRAALHGRAAANSKDVRAVIHSVLRHRVVTNRNARSNGITADRVIDRLLFELPDRVPGDENPPTPGEALSIESSSAADLLDGE